MRILVALAVVVTLVLLLVTTQGKSCHFNVHLKTRLVCTER